MIQSYLVEKCLSLRILKSSNYNKIWDGGRTERGGNQEIKVWGVGEQGGMGSGRF